MRSDDSDIVRLWAGVIQRSVLLNSQLQSPVTTVNGRSGIVANVRAW